MAQTTLTEQLYNLYSQNPNTTNKEATEILGIGEHLTRNTKYKLKTRGLIGIDDDGSVRILKPYRESLETPAGFKAEIYAEMVVTYMDDFRQQSTFNDRLAVGREIRLVLEKM